MQRFRKSWRAVVLAAVMLLALAGCMTIGQDFNHEAVDLIKQNQTTDKEVLKIFGNPLRTGIAEDGAREWTYAHYKGGAFRSLEGRDLVIKFNDNGTVRSYSYHTTDPSEELVKPR